MTTKAGLGSNNNMSKSALIKVMGARPLFSVTGHEWRKEVSAIKREHRERDWGREIGERECVCVGECGLHPKGL